MRRVLCGLVAALGICAAVGFAGPLKRGMSPAIERLPAAEVSSARAALPTSEAAVVAPVVSNEDGRLEDRTYEGSDASGFSFASFAGIETGEASAEVPQVVSTAQAGARGPVATARPRTAPDNDACEDAYEFDLIPGTPVVYQGNNTGATKDCAALDDDFAEVWFKFTTHEPTAEISIRYCGTAPAFENAYTNLVTACPCAAPYLNSDVAEGVSCGDGNITLAWRRAMPAGTYYWPLLTDSTLGHAEGPYTVTFEAIGAMPSLPCPAESLFGQTPQRGASTSGNVPGARYTVWDNFSGVSGKIGGIEWWGIRLQPGAMAWSSCPPENPLEFEIKFYRDDDGEPGAEVASYTVTPTVTYAAPYSYLGDTLHFSSGPLTPCYALENGWVSIASLSNPDGCVFLWMSSPDGDSLAYQAEPGSELENQHSDFAFCLLPGDCPEVYGACCDDYTGDCQQAEANDCLLPRRFTAGAQCGEFDPPCGIVGACCTPQAQCVSTGYEADCDALGGRFWPGETCEAPAFECPRGCEHRIDLRSCLSGWRNNTLDVFVNGETVLSGLTLASGQGPVSYYFWAETGDTIETVYHVVVPYLPMQYYEIFNEKGYWLASDGISEQGDCMVAPTGITIAGDCDVRTTGACCHYEGGCDIVTPEECIDGEFLGVGTPCSRCPACYIICPPGGTHEAEVCGTDTNGGCDAAPPVFESIACGDSIYGTLWSDFPNEEDLDWYELAPTDEFRLLTWTTKSLEEPVVVVMRAGPGGVCDGAEVIAERYEPACHESTITFEAQPGETYWYHIGHITAPVDCDVPYNVTLTCETLAAGACCLPSGECIEQTVNGCAAVFGFYQGDDTDCGSVTCTPTYCVAGSADCTNDYATNVAIGTINNASNCGEGGYEDYTSLSTNILIGSPNAMVVTGSLPWSTQCQVWVDYNHNFDFTDPGENTTAVYQGGTYQVELTPPVDALLGPTRMRIRIGYYSGQGTGSCGVRDAGEVEDYTVNIVDGPGACCTPSGECLTLSSAVDCIVNHEGAWFPGETCEADGGSFVCPAGACCTPAFQCVTADRATCEQLYAGTWHLGETCVDDGGDFECPIPDFGACCDSADYCSTLHGTDAGYICQMIGGTWHLGETCVSSGGDYVCQEQPGACCDGQGNCYMVASEMVCMVEHGGEWYPDEVCLADGGDFECPTLGPGACCDGYSICRTMDSAHDCIINFLDGTWYPGETCVEDGGEFECPFNGGSCCMYGGLFCLTSMSEYECEFVYEGTYYPGERCASNGGSLECPFTGGACCTPEGECFTAGNAQTCFYDHAGTYYPGEECVETGGSFVCPGGTSWCDLDGNDFVDYDDYVIFLAAFGGPVDGDPAQDAACDFDNSGAVGLADYNAWLECYRDFIGDPLAGPPSAPGTPMPTLGGQGGLKKKSLPAAGAAEAAQPAAGSSQASGVITKLSR